MFILWTICQGTLKESTESEQHLVEAERTAGWPEPAGHVHTAPGAVHSGNNGPDRPYIPVLPDARGVPDTQGVRVDMEWWQLHLGGGPRQVVQKQQKKLDMKPIEQGSSTQGAPGDDGTPGNHHQHPSEEQIQEWGN